MLPRAIFFDLDDTLLRYNISLESAWKKACDISLEDSKTIKTPYLIHQIDIVREWYWSDTERHQAGRLNLHSARTDIVRMALERLGYTDEQTASNIAANYAEIMDETLGFFPNYENTLDELVRKDVKLALLTNGAGAVQLAKIKRFGIARYFPVCLIEGELGYGKPDKRVFEMALSKLYISPNQAWMVGDDLERDIAGAHSAGIFSIWHDYRKKGLPADSKIKPDKIINDITELLTM